MKNMKNKKILTGIVVGVALIILIITGVCMSYKKTQNRMSISTPELARAITYGQFEEGDDAVDNTDNVKFSAFFLRDLDGDGYAEKIKGTCKQIGSTDTLYMEINVQTGGYLKDAQIEIAGQNFKLQTTLPKDEEFKDSYIGTDIKTIEFNQLNNGTQKLFTGLVSSVIGNNINNYSRTDNKIILTGTYVAEDNTEIQITKEIPLTIDWYGTTKTTISATNQTYYDLPSRIDEESGTIKLKFSVSTNETNQKLNLSKNHVEGTIPELNGYAPISVTMTNTTSANLSFNYDETTRTFSIDRTATVAEDGTITTSVARSNSYNLEVTYPIEAYQAAGEDTVSISVPVQTYYEGYNNPNSEFTNPYRSSASATITANFQNPVPAGKIDPTFSVTVGKYIYNPTSRYMVSKQKPLRIYNGLSEEEKDDTYIVRWYANTGTDGETTGLVMKETKNGETQVTDEFVKADSSTDSMENVTSNIGIYFTGADKLLKEDGWIKVYDEETGNLLATFTKDNWNTYTSSNPYKYELPVKHIRVETSETNSESSIYVYNIKELDDEYITTNYTEGEFDDLKYIKSTLNGYLGGEYVTTATHQANYEAPYSLATISLSNNKISTQATEESEKITITASYDTSSNQAGWIDGSFLVKLPDEMLAVEINSVEIDNSSVEITSYEVIEDENGTFIKINTENNTDVAQGYIITIDADITPDPRIASVTRTIELYASNNDATEYYYEAQDIYDVNNNLNTEEMVNKATTSINLIAPGSLLTNQTASEYDEKNSVIVSPQIADIIPKYAKVDNEKQTAKVGLQVKNNYSSTISEIMILGKIPFEGNTTVVSGKDLGSNFTVHMESTGVEIPEELQGKITVYYSENETPDKDLSNEANGWKTAENITDWENVKTFLIDFQDEVIEQGQEYVFYYKIDIPQGLEFNKVAYSHHGVYFSLDTDQGKYKTQTEPNRIGFRIAEKFNLEIVKTQTGKEKLVAGATYSVTEISEDGTAGDAKTAVTDENGTLTIKNLYAERTYEIQEIKTPDDYELNGDIIRIIGHVDENGTLTIEKTQGTTKEDITVTKNEGEMHKVTVKVEDEAKAKLRITKVEQGTETPVSYVKYKLKGTGLPTNGRILTTNANGEASISGLKINEEYTLEETKATGYYLADTIKFKIVNNDGTYQVEVTEGTVLANNVTEEDSLPIANLTLEDEKIPTYSLEIFKIKRTVETTLSTDELIAKAEGNLAGEETDVLAGAKFKLYKGTQEIGTYITGEDGKITIENLYQYVDGKDEEATYTLKEVLAPDGYAKVKDITFKAQVVDSTLTLINTSGEEEKYTVDGTTIKLVIEDSPSFKLIKKDAETGEVVANVKFAIYNVDDGEVPATNSKGEILGTKEIINGKEYYTVTTDSNGIITADLTEGLYKAVEVEAPDKYDIEDSTYYFGIGASREGKTGLQAEWAVGIGGSYYDAIKIVIETSDGGYVVGGYFSSSINLGNRITLTNNSSSTGDSDGMLIKYSASGEVEWAQAIGGNYNDYINTVIETSDGGYAVGGYFRSSSIDLGNGVTLTSSGSYDGMLIKYSSEGEAEWAKKIGGSYSEYIYSVAETSNGGYIVGGYFSSSSINLGNGVKLTNSGSSGSYDGMLIKYSSEGEIESAQAIGGSSDDRIYSVSATSDGGYIVGGYFQSSSIDLGNGVTLTNNSSSTSYSDGMLIKYSSEGDVEWAQAIGGSYSEAIEIVIETSDGGYVVGGYFSSSINLGNGVTLTSSGSSDGMLIKYSASGVVEWAQAIGGSSGEDITSVAETSDGGYVVGGYFLSSSIDLGNGVIAVGNKNISNDEKGILIKYSSDGVAQFAMKIGENVKSVSETSDGGCIVGGYFSSSVNLGNGVTLTSSGDSDGMLIKYNPVEVPEIVIKEANGIGGSSYDYIDSVVETSDGGYIVGGYFYSSSINLGNGVTLTNNSRSTIYYDGMLIKYSASGEIEWAQAIGGYDTDVIESVIETSDGGYVVGGYFNSSSIKLGNGVTLTKNGNYDGMLIKYSSEGVAEWAKAIGGSSQDYIYSVAETSDGGYIVGGYFQSSSIDLGNGVKLANSGSYDGMLIKYRSEGEVEWAKAIGGSSQDYIYSVAETSDGGYIVGGHFKSSSIDLGNGVTLTSSGNSDGMLIKYSASGEVEWAQAIVGSSSDEIYSVSGTSDGGYIAVGLFYDNVDFGNGVKITGSGNQEGMLIKYSKKGEVEWARAIGGAGSDFIKTVIETSDGGYIVGGYFQGASGFIDLGNGVTLTNNSSGYSDGMIIKYSASGDAKWAQAIGGSNYEYIYSVVETSDGSYIAGGYFQSSSIELENGMTLTNNGGYDGMIIKIAEEMGVPEVQEIIVENERKEFKITTDVNEIDGIKGGTISGEDEKAYEKVKYGDSGTKEIIMTPDENYEIIGITVNGEEYPFTANEDGTFTMPAFTNVTEDKHIEVTYSLKDNKITINKVDSETQEPLPGATFQLDQLEEREEPENENVIGTLTDNGQEYDEADFEKEVTSAIGELTDNGEGYEVTVDTTTEVEDVLGELTSNGTYYFVEEDGKYVPTNSKTYQTANGGTAGKGSTTANSYIEIDLSEKTGNYVVVVNAYVSSQSSYDYGYATIREESEGTTAPTYSNNTGRFIYISGTVEATDYTSMALVGGRKYYLHLGYYKNGSTDTDEDQIVINSIKVYGATCTRYNFVENEGKYESTNQGQASTVANSYIPIDLTNYEGKYALIVNANVSSQSSDYGYATVTETTTRPAYNSSTGRFIYISGTSTTATTPTDYQATLLEGGKVYYLHLGYYKNASTDTGDDKFTVNSVKLYETKVVTYNFIENEGKYESTIQGMDSRVANSYIPIDLTNYEGKYNLIVNANVSSQSSGDYGYATVTETTTRPAYNSSTGRFIYISGTTEAVTTPTDYTTVLEGEKLYYLHLGYYKNSSTSTGDDKFTVNSVSVTLNDSDLYHVEVTTNSEGQAITQIPFGKYSITETQAPEGYELNENSIVVEFRADQEPHTFTIENNKLAKVIVHHYLKDTTTKVAEDEILQDKSGYQYTTLPRLDLEKYELEKGEDGNYIIPENATGQYVSGEEIIVTYYYEEKLIPLTVNHYIEGTETSVPLLNGDKAETVTSQGKEGETYTTTAIPNSELSDDYELVEDPSNSSGTYSGESVEVTYYYKKVVRSITINKYQEDGTTPLEGAKFTIANKDESKNQVIKTEKIQDNGTYYFEKNGNKYISNNQGKGSTTANSYIKIDLTKSESAILTVNAEISSESGCDYGYATITETTSAPSYSSTTGQFIKISGTVKAKDYTTELEGGKVHYLHLGYRKDSSVNTGTDTFTINSIKIDGVDYLEYIDGQNYTTDSKGKIETTLEVGKYIITEIEAPEGYQLPENATQEIVITRDTENISLDITNERKQGQVTVHHYLEGTETPVTTADGTPIEDTIKTGYVGDMYATTEANNKATKYELVAVPANASGNITEEETVVTYYYRLKDTSVLVHHYLEGTEESVSPDVTINGQVDDQYTTEVTSDILDAYELVAEPANKAGTMTEEQIIVTYYYSLRVANITHAKSQQIETGKNFVIAGDKITYTVTVSNSGNLGKDVVVKDNIPAGTSFVEGSIKIDGVVQNAMTAQDLSDGITINVPMAENGEASQKTLSFEVTVNEGTTGDIKNTATVDEESTTQVKVPVVTYEKEATITRKHEETTLGENEVTVGDTINYVIKVHNTGTTKVEDIEVRDTIPSGTVLKTISNNGVQEENEIVWTIPEIEANSTTEVGFTVEVQYSSAEYTITNKATVEGKETNEIENPYKMPEAKLESTIEKKGTDKVVTKDMKVYYEIKFTANVDDFMGNAKVTLVDTLPYPIDEENSNIANGQYDETTKTITWVEEINNIDTFTLGTEKEITMTKILELSYNYGNINDITASMENKVNSKIELLEQSAENPEEYIVVTEDNQEAIAETLVEIPTQVKVHHYIYDAEKNEYTTVKLVEDETIDGFIGQKYSTTPSSSVPANYDCITETPDKHEGKMTEETIEVTYYYQLITSTIENTIEKTATVETITKEDGEITYNIKYNVTIKDYIGKATIEIVDTLPANIDTQKSDLAGGVYDETTRTITWTENVEGINTFADGDFTKEITKQIKLVYSNQNVVDDLVNTVTGTTKTYYPENHTTKPGEVQLTNTATDNETVKQEYKVALKVEKEWEDNDDLKGKRPESVTIEITGMPDGNVISEVLDAENEWKCEITDLQKYDAEGNKIIYEVTEKETTTGDLEYYEEAEITSVETQTEEVTNYVFTVTNTFKLLNTDLKAEITKQGTEEITSSRDVVEYTINFKAEIIDYIGGGKVKIVDTLPYKIDEENSELSGGIYDDEQQTITWVEELPHINTDVSGENYKVDITKTIQVLYKDIDLSLDKMTNKVDGKVELYESEEKEEKETTFDTNINVNGKVIVKYVDKDNGKDIDANYNYEIISKVGNNYETSKKEIDNYEYIESTNNETGKITEEDQEVIYYYSRIKTSVLVKYQDTEGNELLPDVLINGQVLDTYTTEQKEIENYRLASVTDNKEGTMTKEQIVVIYVYEKIPTKVTVKYLEKDVETGEEKELLPEEVIEGFAGDEYNTERKVIENYRTAEPEPDNKTGKMTSDPIEVIYYYERIPSGTITVRYVDIDTKEDIAYIEGTEEKAYRYEIKGYIGDEYETEQKEIPYYEFVENTENVKGMLTEKEDTVTYYYRKLTFNFSVEKTIASVTLNGEAMNVTNNKITKVEVRARQIPKTELIVSYSIKVANNGEILGKAKLQEIIPQGFEVIGQNEWKLVDEVLETEVELKPGEERNLSINLRWLNSENNIGTGNNMVQITKTENPANYEEVTLEDNTSSAQVIVGVTTGPKFEELFKVELAMSVVIIMLLILNAGQVSIIKKKK